MQDSPYERAMALLGDYLFELETGHRGNNHGKSPARTIPSKRDTAIKFAPLAPLDPRAEYVATLWEKEKLKEWKEEGRITDDGTLRVGRDPLTPYTLDDIMRTMPHLGVFDRLAALIDLNGVVEEGFMEAHENIKEVVSTIADEAVNKALQHPDTKERIADICQTVVGQIFGTLLVKLKSSPSPTRVGGRQNKCGKCRQPGHRAKTCQATPEDIAAFREQHQAGGGAAQPDASA